jgi:hypothetical protein
MIGAMLPLLDAFRTVEWIKMVGEMEKINFV